MTIATQTSNNLIRRLQDFSIVSNQNSSTQNAIATTLLQFIFAEKVNDYTLEDLAFYCNASPATFSRFIRELGYENYKAFKQTVLLISIDHNHSMTDNFSISCFQQTIHEKIDETADLLRQQDLETIVNAIASPHPVYFFGIHYTEMLLKEFQYRLLKLGKHILWTEGYVNQFDTIQQIEEHSVCIFFSFGGRFIQAILPFLLNNKKHITTFLITAKDSEKYQSFFDDVIYVSQQADAGNKEFQLQFFTEILLEKVKRKL